MEDEESDSYVPGKWTFTLPMHYSCFLLLTTHKIHIYMLFFYISSVVQNMPV